MVTVKLYPFSEVNRHDCYVADCNLRENGKINHISRYSVEEGKPETSICRPKDSDPLRSVFF